MFRWIESVPQQPGQVLRLLRARTVAHQGRADHGQPDEQRPVGDVEGCGLLSEDGLLDGLGPEERLRRGIP